MKRLAFAFRFWSAAHKTADAIGRVAHTLASYCHRQSTRANLALVSSITAGRR